MRKRFFIIIQCCMVACMAFAMQANAQPRPDSVSVHAGQEPLRFLLTDEQKETIKYLTVTGTLLDEDYEYIREELITKLKELNLKEADIDTIPAYGFKCDKSCDKSSMLDNLLLPKGIKHISDAGMSYLITSKKDIKTIEIYDVKGRSADRMTVKAKEAGIGKATLPKPYAIVKFSLEYRTAKTVKLMSH